MLVTTCLFYIIFQVFKVLLTKICKIFYLFLFLLAFTSADIIVHKFLGLHSKLSEKKIFVINFSFLTDSLTPPPPPQPLNDQNPLSVTKFFVDPPLGSYMADGFSSGEICHIFSTSIVQEN